MAVTHESVAGMGGIRTCGDLVFRMQLAGMKINDAKAFVANKLKVSMEDIVDCAVMKEVREELNLGTVFSRPNAAVGIQAKFRIAELLGISINSVEKFKKEAGI